MNDNYNLTDKELEQLKNAQGDTDAWNSLCDEIKSRRNGQWPPDWYIKVIANPDIDTRINIESF